MSKNKSDLEKPGVEEGSRVPTYEGGPGFKSAHAVAPHRSRVRTGVTQTLSYSSNYGLLSRENESRR